MSAVQTHGGKFHHVGIDSESCSCPVHTGHGAGPASVPLGIRFADRVSIQTITDSEAEEIYQRHHGYVDTIPDMNITHHGIFFEGDLQGAITWRTGLCQHRKLRWDSEGTLLPRRASELDYNGLPDEYHGLAEELIDHPDSSDIADTEVVSGGKFVRASRICVAVEDFPNLASCALAKSQARFVADHANRLGTEYLVTFVMCDYPGSMIRALRDRGWRCTGFAEPSQPGNRDAKPINSQWKWRWICPVETVTEQIPLTDWL
jgi:hypothetical protein